MPTDPAPRLPRPRSSRVTRATLSILAAGALLVSACGGGDTGDATQEDPTTTTRASTTTPTTGDSEPGSSTTDVGPEPIMGEFHAVEPGIRLIDTLGTPLVLDLTGEWWVQPNGEAFTVLSHPDNNGPGDRDVIFVRPSGLAEPDRVNDSLEDLRAQNGWPLSDIEGWLDGVPPGLVDGDPVDTTLGGWAAVRFDVEVAEDFPCGPQICAGFVTENGNDFVEHAPGQRWTIWWVDDGDQGPLAVLVGRDADDSEWLGTAEALLATVELG